MSMSESRCGTRLPVATTEARPSAATMPAPAAYAAQLRGARSSGAPGTRRASRVAYTSPNCTQSAANMTVRRNVIPAVPGASASPVPSSAAEGPSSGMSAATATRTRTVTARAVEGRRRGARCEAWGVAVTASAVASPPGSADGCMELTTRSSPGAPLTGKS